MGTKCPSLNLTPDQLALTMAKHYEKTKKDPHVLHAGNDYAKRDRQKERVVSDSTDKRIGKLYGVSPATVRRNVKFAAAVETLKAVDPEIDPSPGPARRIAP